MKDIPGWLEKLIPGEDGSDWCHDFFLLHLAPVTFFLLFFFLFVFSPLTKICKGFRKKYHSASKEE